MPEGSEFDTLANEYEQVLQQDLGAISNDVQIFAEYKVKLARSLLTSSPGKLLEFGCGIGRNFPFFLKFFPETKLSGCDISHDSVAIANNQFPDCRFFISNSIDKFLHDADMYDACFVACVFHHIAPDEWEHWLDAIRQRLRPGGEIILFEHNLYNPLVKRIVTKSPIDANANFLTKRELTTCLRKTGYAVLKEGYTMFFPRRNACLEAIEWRLRHVPLGGQYFILGKNDTAL